jgi:hypothetical protein
MDASECCAQRYECSQTVRETCGFHPSGSSSHALDQDSISVASSIHLHIVFVIWGRFADEFRMSLIYAQALLVFAYLALL